MMQKRHKSQTLVIKATQGLRGRRTTLGFRQDKKTGDEIRRQEMQEGKQRGRKDKLYAQMSAQRSEIWGGLVGVVVFVKINSSNQKTSTWSLKKKKKD